MSREIVEAVRGLAAEKNISSEKLMEALEDALLSAYKKTPDAARYAKVEMDRDSGDFKVWELKIPPELEEQLLVEATPDQQLLFELRRDLQLPDLEVAALTVHLDLRVARGAGRLLIGRQQRVLERLHQLLGGDVLLGCEAPYGFKDFT